MSLIKYLYREYSCSLSQKSCTALLQALAISEGVITSNFTLKNAFPEKSVGRWTMFFRLRFRNQESLDKFHTLGFVTTEPEKVVGNGGTNSVDAYAQN